MANQKYLLRFSKTINRIKKGDYPNLNTILDYLSDEGFSIDKRTFNRDKLAIEDLLDTEIIYNRNRNGYYINEEEENSIFSKKLQETLDLFSSLKIAGKNDEILHFEKRKSVGSKHLGLILQSIKEHVQLSFTHHKFQDKKATERTVEPYLIKESQGRWYLLANDLKDNRIKTFALDRFLSIANMSKKKFKKPNDLDLKNYFKNSFGIINLHQPKDVVLKFTGYNASFVKSYQLHTSQKVIEEKQGYKTFSLHLSITEDFMMELMKYGADLEIIAPSSLRKRIKERHLKACEINS